MSNFLQNGCGESTGDELCTSRPLLLPTSNSVWYVNSAIGTDAASPAGKNREKPLATLAQAITNAQANDIIVLMDGHAESTTSFMTLSTAGVKIVGAGSSGGIPTVTFTFGVGGGISLDGAGNEIRNVKFASRSAADTLGRLFLKTKTAAKGCYFECGANDTGPALVVGNSADTVEVDGCTFISVATSSSAQPESAIKSIAAAATDLAIRDTTISDGTVGFSNNFAMDLSVAAFTRLKLERVAFVLGASGIVHASSTGYALGCTTTGGGNLLW